MEAREKMRTKKCTCSFFGGEKNCTRPQQAVKTLERSIHVSRFIEAIKSLQKHFTFTDSNNKQQSYSKSPIKIRENQLHHKHDVSVSKISFIKYL